MDGFYLFLKDIVRITRSSFLSFLELRDSNAQEIDELKKQLQTVRSQLEIQKSSVTSSSDQKEAMDELNSQLAETKRVNEEFKKEKTSLESQVEQLKVELENKG